MAIQFPCPSCHKQIEIDGEWAGRTVECPYCQAAVPAPSAPASDTGDRVMARPIAESPQYGFAEPYSEKPTGNPIAVVALVLALIGTALIVAMSLVAQAKLAAMFPPGATPTPEQLQEAMKSAMQKGDMGLAVASLGMLAGGLVALAGFVCAIVALTRPVRRGIAIAALLIAIAPVLLVLAQLVAG